MKGILISALDPLVKEAIESSGCLRWLATSCEDFTPITTYINPTIQGELFKTKTESYFEILTESWKEDLSKVLYEIYTELPSLAFHAIVFDETDLFYILTRIQGSNSTLIRHAKAQYVRTFQNPEIVLEEVIL